MNDDYTPGPLPPAACATCGEVPYYTKAHIDAAVAAAVAKERERCALICDAVADMADKGADARGGRDDWDVGRVDGAEECALKIRASRAAGDQSAG